MRPDALTSRSIWSNVLVRLGLDSIAIFAVLMILDGRIFSGGGFLIAAVFAVGYALALQVVLAILHFWWFASSLAWHRLFRREDAAIATLIQLKDVKAPLPEHQFVSADEYLAFIVDAPDAPVAAKELALRTQGALDTLRTHGPRSEAIIICGNIERAVVRLLAAS